MLLRATPGGGVALPVPPLPENMSPPAPTSAPDPAPALGITPPLGAPPPPPGLALGAASSGDVPSELHATASRRTTSAEPRAAITSPSITSFEVRASSRKLQRDATSPRASAIAA